MSRALHGVGGAPPESSSATGPASPTSLFAELIARGSHVTLRARGGSMWPALRDGDVLTIAPLDRPPARGEVVAALCGGALTVHRFLRFEQAQQLLARSPEQAQPVPARSPERGRPAAALAILRGDALLREDRPLNSAALIGRVVRVRRGAREISRRWWSGPLPLLLRPISRAALRLARRLRALRPFSCAAGASEVAYRA